MYMHIWSKPQKLAKKWQWQTFRFSLYSFWTWMHFTSMTSYCSIQMHSTTTDNNCFSDDDTQSGWLKPIQRWPQNKSNNNSMVYFVLRKGNLKQTWKFKLIFFLSHFCFYSFIVCLCFVSLSFLSSKGICSMFICRRCGHGLWYST